ncbi:hypothetical protein C2S51_020092 [Perilla frutescens var. frutescens]|nr:hypothetical protein C2S51_020092 [Perilla frutescens var. frutescens]
MVHHNSQLDIYGSPNSFPIFFAQADALFSVPYSCEVEKDTPQEPSSTATPNIDDVVDDRSFVNISSADPVTKEPYADLMNVQRTIQISESGSADERSILRQSHPSHRGYHVGVGPTLPSFWLAFGEETSSSTETSTTSTMEDRARIRRLEEIVLDLVDVL